MSRTRGRRQATGRVKGQRGARGAQLELPLPKAWGGRRPGAGRKPAPGRSPTPHRARGEHKARHPVHVTLRSGFRPLRSQHVFPTVCHAVAGANRRDPASFRILQFSVQFDHVHLVVQASDKRALASGVRSLAIRIARYVNELVMRKGAFWADRWFGRELTSPRQVRNALVYVLANFRKHSRSRVPAGVDPFSSGLSFDGWRGFSRGAGRVPPLAGTPVRCEPKAEDCVSEPSCWLAARGWRVHGLVALDEAPRGDLRAH